MLGIPQPRRDPYGNVRAASIHEIDAGTLTAALDSMAHFIKSKGENLTVISVGGAVNTLLLRTRQSTHDVDFFGTNLDNRQRRLLDEAAFYAATYSQVSHNTSLRGEWFNNQTQVWLPQQTHQRLTQTALEQNEIVYQQPELRIVAALWNYAFSAKVARIMTRKFRPYDPTDAADYLHYYIRQHTNRPVMESQIRAWAQEFRHETSPQILQQVNVEYKRRYGQDGIVCG